MRRSLCWRAGPLWSSSLLYINRYELERELQRRRQQPLPPRAKKAIRLQARQSMLERWDAHLSDPRTPGQRTVGAIRPCLAEWVGRAQGEVTFRATQILTGHGCFDEYLFRIGRERTTDCHHCGHGRDTAQYTLEECPAWNTLRRALKNVVGEDLSLPDLVSQMVGSEEAWSAFSSFCEAVMLQKEKAERVRRNEAEAAAESDRDGRGGGRQTLLPRLLAPGQKTTRVASPPVRRR